NGRLARGGLAKEPEIGNRRFRKQFRPPADKFAVTAPQSLETRKRIPHGRRLNHTDTNGQKLTAHPRKKQTKPTNQLNQHSSTAIRAANGFLCGLCVMPSRFSADTSKV